MGSPSHFVPNEIVEAVLLKLPVRSLLLFKIVSKHFLSLISSPRFISAHYQNSKARPSSVIFRSGQSLSLCSNPGATPMLEVLDKPLLKQMDLVGCANGIVCIQGIYEYRTIFALWNPATKQCRYEIPCPWYGLSIIGFGYHAGIEDYKLFSIPKNYVEYKPRVLQLKSDTSRDIELGIGLQQDINYYYCSAVVVSGVWYQVCDIDSGPSILSFDLKDDSFALMDPPFSRDEIKLGVALGVRDQELRSFTMSIERWCRGWMMVEASWIEMFTIDLCPKVHSSLRLRSTWQGTRLLLENIASYYSFDIAPGTILHDSLIRHVAPRIGYHDVHEAYDFVESLVSPTSLEI